jgi:hypothetical protein
LCFVENFSLTPGFSRVRKVREEKKPFKRFFLGAFEVHRVKTRCYVNEMISTKHSGCYNHASPTNLATPLAHGVKFAASGVMPGKFFLPPFPSGGMPGWAQPDRSRSKNLKSGISLYDETISQYNIMISQYNKMISQYNKMVSLYWEMILQYNKMISLYWEKVSPYWERISQYNKMVSSYWEVILQYNKMISLYWEKVSTYWEMISQYKEMAGLPSFSGLF